VSRLAGATPAETAAAVATRIGSSPAVVLVEPTTNPGQALAAAALGAARGVPVLLGDPGAVPAVTQAALATLGTTEIAVVAGTELPDSALVSGLGGRSFSRLSGVDARAGAVSVAGAFPAQSGRVWLMPDQPNMWGAVPALAATGAPILFTAATGLSAEPAGYITGRAGLTSVSSAASEKALGDPVLGSASRLLLGQAAPDPTITPVPTPSMSAASPPPVMATATRRLGRTNASPEPVKRGAALRVRATISARYSDGRWRAVPTGVPFTVYFRASGKRSWVAKASGATGIGEAVATTAAASSGWWRIKVGTKYSASDYVKVRR
jgi:hypothetical protein